MNKPTKPILQFKDKALTNERQILIKGGGDAASKIAKLQLKLANSIAKGDHKGMLKSIDQLDCLGYTTENNGGNGLGIW